MDNGGASSKGYFVPDPKVGLDLDVPAGMMAARQTGLAILSTVRNHLGSLDRVIRLVKSLGMVNCTPNFGE